MPGTHVLEWRFHSADYRVGYRDYGDTLGHGTLRVRVEAGRTYRLLASGKFKTVVVLPQLGRPDLLLNSSINPNFGRKPIDYAAALSLDDVKK